MIRFISLVAGLCLLSSSLNGRTVDVHLPFEKSSEDSELWIALDAGPGFGSTVIQVSESRRVFVAFQADWAIQVVDGSVSHVRQYKDYQWKDVEPNSAAVEIAGSKVGIKLSKNRYVDRVRSVRAFEVGADGELGVGETYISRRENEIYLPEYDSVTEGGQFIREGRYGAPGERPVIYQMLPRLFGNENETRKINGTLEENGSGKFSDLSDDVLANFKEEGFSHIWLTGVLQQATSTDYSEAGQPADDPDLLKGIAGSPYAIRDYFDVCPDYADEPEKRLEEFKALIERMHAKGLSVVIDFVPNHVARSYGSDIRPELAFGVNDRRDVYFSPNNNFFYLKPEVAAGKAPLRLPTVDPKTGEVINETARLVGNADGYFPPENEYGRVTGNNVSSWQPSNGDWYETVKLNYGFDFLNREAPPEYLSAVSPRKPVPDTWKKMDSIIAYWQELGVDGFRADMAHMVPPEFWKWMIHRAQERDPNVFFFAEAYNDDPAKVPGHDPALPRHENVMVALLDAGFHAVYDDPGYDTLEHLFEGHAWANDLQDVQTGLGAFFFDCAVRYAENHDEIRLAHPNTWGGQGMQVGKPITATLFALSRGPVMLYHGQEVGEPGLGREGFGGDDKRSTIFDYWSLPELNKWWNDGAADGGRLSDDQKSLREWYVRLLQLQHEPALTKGNTFLLNHANRDNPFYGKVEDVGPSGHWFHSHIRSTPAEDDHFLITSNFHSKSALRHVRIRLPESARESLGLNTTDATWLILEDRLNPGSKPRAVRVEDALREGIYFDTLAPLSVSYWEISYADKPAAGAIMSPSLPTGDAFLGAPPLQRARAGSEIRIDLRRYGNPGTTHRFSVTPVEGIEATIDHLNHVLYLNVAGDASGLMNVALDLEPLDASGEHFHSSLPVAIESIAGHTFEFEGRLEASGVALVGDFNGWNTSSHPMERTETGWTITTYFNPGHYAYKFVVDGSWEPDPKNEERAADGHGGFNSLIHIEGGSNDPAATVFLSSANKRQLTIRSDRPLANIVAQALPDAGGVIELKSKIIDLREANVMLAGAPEGALVRILVEDANGKVGLPVIAYAGEATKDTWRDDIIYYAFTDRFYDGEKKNTKPVERDDVADAANYQGGDFQGIRKKLEEGYFEDLGVNILWLAPLNQNPQGAWQEYLPPFRHYTGYHGYWPVERFGVEKRFGGESELRKLISKAHKNEMKVLADLVLKHVHIENPIRQERPELFGQLELSDGSRNLRRWDDNPFTTWFEPFLPAFDFRNPESINFLLEDAEYWISEYKLDGYRLDAVKHIRPDFWWRFRSHMRDSFPDANHYFVGETFQSRQGIADFVGPNMLDGQFDFPLYDVLVPTFAQEDRGFDQLEGALRESEEVYGRSVRMSALVGNHDKSRFMAYADGDLPDPEEDDAEEVGWSKWLTVDDPAAYEKLKMAMTFLLTIDGVPMIYYGDEIGMTGAGDPDNRRMMRFGEDVTEPETAVKEHFSKLCHARRDHPSLYLGSRRVLTADWDTYAYVRAHGNDRSLVVFNRSDQPRRFALDLDLEMENAELKDVLTGNIIEVRKGRALFTIPPETSAVFTGKL